jgi:branched-chain amino acid transport system ATP-binding protein
VTESALRVKGLRVSYGRASAVRGVSFDVERGSICAIVGPNGAGKSSLLLGIQGIVKADYATLELGGRSLAGSNSTDRARYGMVLVPQGRQIFPTLSVRENLQVVADGLRLKKGVVDEALARFPILVQRAGSPAGVLSGGEQKMLALARALMCAPSVLLLDEPTEGLAQTIVAEVVAVLNELQRAGGTIVIVEPTTRVLPEGINLGLVMMRGEIVARTSKREELQRMFLERYERISPKEDNQ